MDNDAGISEHISCPICQGFLIDTITLTHCSHFFCRACFLRHLQTEKTCPTCKEQLLDLKTAFFPDQSLQDFVYKYAPSTYWKEMRQRIDFLQKRFPTPLEKKLIADWNLTQFAKHLCVKDEKISLCVEYISPKDILDNQICELPQDKEPVFRRYFRCSAQVTMGHIKTILKGKFDLPDNYVLHFVDLNSLEVLEDSYSLQDLVYIFGWLRTAPLKLLFTLTQIVSDEEQPPILHMEFNTSTTAVKEALDDKPPSLEPEHHEKMPMLTVNLSSELFKSDAGGSRMPIITEAVEPPPKKRRKAAKKKEKTIGQCLIKPNIASKNDPLNGFDLKKQNGTGQIMKTTPSPVNSLNTTTTPSSTSQSPKLVLFEQARAVATTPPERSRPSSTFSLPVQMSSVRKSGSITPANTPEQCKTTSEPVTPIAAVVADLKFAKMAQNMKNLAAKASSDKAFKDAIANHNEQNKFVVPSTYISASFA